MTRGSAGSSPVYDPIYKNLNFPKNSDIIYIESEKRRYIICRIIFGDSPQLLKKVFH